MLVMCFKTVLKLVFAICGLNTCACDVLLECAQSGIFGCSLSKHKYMCLGCARGLCSDRYFSDAV